MIRSMGFAGYFLIVSDFINYAKEKNIPVGPGRGSAAGSLVAYAIGITSIDPIRYNLFFERFLNPDRISMPDIDTDFCPEGQGRDYPLCDGKIRERQGIPDHHLRQDAGKGRHPGCRQGDEYSLRRGGSDCQNDSQCPQHQTG